MTANAPSPDGKADDLEGMLGRGLGPREHALRHSTLRLQPTVLPPPPAEGRRAAVETGAFDGASPADDIDLGFNDDGAARRRQLLLAGAGIGIALLGVAGWLLFGRPVVAPAEAPPKAIQALPAPAQPAAPAQPVPPPVQEAAPAPTAVGQPSPTAQAADPAMGELATELVPPSTEGLSPARKVNAVRIIMDGDREVR